MNKNKCFIFLFFVCVILFFSGFKIPYLNNYTTINKDIVRIQNQFYFVNNQDFEYCFLSDSISDIGSIFTLVRFVKGVNYAHSEFRSLNLDFYNESKAIFDGNDEHVISYFIQSEEQPLVTKLFSVNGKMRIAIPLVLTMRFASEQFKLFKIPAYIYLIERKYTEIKLKAFDFYSNNLFGVPFEDLGVEDKRDLLEYRKFVVIIYF